jgi:hypothetical protein
METCDRDERLRVVIPSARHKAIERTDKVELVVRALRRAGGRCLGGELERRTNSSVGRASTRTTTQQCNYQDAKAAPCM